MCSVVLCCNLFKKTRLQQTCRGRCKDRQKQHHLSEAASCELRQRGLGYALEFWDGSDSMQQGGARQGVVETGGHKRLG